MIESFKKTIKMFSNVTDSQIEEFYKITKLKDFAIGESFVKEHEAPSKLAFNVKGLFRYYYIDNDCNEFTKGFFPENTFISSYSAMIQNRTSFFTIEALEDSSLLVFNYSDFMQLVNKHDSLKLFLIKMLEMGYCHKEAREREFLLFDAKTRYKLFLKNFPGLEKRIKQHLIASYLGITPVALSRIRKKNGFINLG